MCIHLYQVKKKVIVLQEHYNVASIVPNVLDCIHHCSDLLQSYYPCIDDEVTLESFSTLLTVLNANSDSQILRKKQKRTSKDNHQHSVLLMILLVLNVGEYSYAGDLSLERRRKHTQDAKKYTLDQLEGSTRIHGPTNRGKPT